MTHAQKVVLRKCLVGIGPGFFHHGWCVGSDEEGDGIAREVGYNIIGHPPIKPDKMAVLPDPFIMCDPKPYLDRDLDIAIASSIVIATPKGYKEEQRSGTWATIRRARKHSMFVIIIYPDGSFTTEEHRGGS